MAGMRPMLMVALVLCSASASAQMYKWIDAKGTVHYTDTPPPANARKADVKAEFKAAASSVQTSSLPYALAQTVRNHPVTLYAGTSCTPCDQGRSLLKARGIPFAEKVVSSAADVARLRAAGSDGNVPFLLVGQSKNNGFSSAAWTEALTAAGYPEQSLLPKTYQYPAAEPAAPLPAPVAPAAAPEVHPRAEPAQPRERKPKPDTPPGFQF